MPVKQDASGRRSVEVETEVPGAPEAVWQATTSSDAGATDDFVVMPNHLHGIVWIMERDVVGARQRLHP